MTFDLSAYLARIGLGGEPLGTDLRTLQRCHEAHLAAIPFENLDVQMARPIRLDIESLEAKLVRRRRGGYCFEQNTLFMHALRTLGFRVSPREARVRNGASTLLPRTHMLLVVQADGADWLCDVGFGAGSPIQPVPLSGDLTSQGPWTYRVRAEEPLRVLQWKARGAWVDLYAVEPGERPSVDFEMANWYTSTFPESRFVLTLTAQRSTREARYILRNLTYSEDRGEAVFTREIDRMALLPLLRDRFLIDVEAGATFRALDRAAAAAGDAVR